MDFIERIRQARTISKALLFTISFVCTHAIANICPQIYNKFYQENKVPAHRAITHDLFNGRVTEATPFSKNNNQTPLMKVTVKNDQSGRTRSALFKPRRWGDQEGWARQPIEYVAYELNLMLGMDYIPPVAYRRNLTINGQTHAEGAMLHLVEDPHSIYKVPEQEWGIQKDLLLSDVRILDVLIQNSDRHKENFLRGKHWVDGSYRPMFIDQAAGFRSGASVKMDQDNAFGTGPVRTARKNTYEALKRLNINDVRAKFKEFLNESEMQDLIKRRDEIVSYLDQLIAKNGYQNTIIDG